MSTATGKKARKVHGTRAAAKRGKPRTSKYAEKQARKYPVRTAGNK